MRVFSGVLPVIPTPFADDGAVDLESLRRVVNHAIACGINTLVYPGVASEDVQLSVEERTACVQSVTQAAAGRVQVIGGVNSPDAEEMIRLAGLMKEHGVNGIMAMAVPSMNEQGLARCFRAIADAAQGLPIVLQNLFSPRGADLSASEMLELAREVDAIRYVKEEGIPSGPKVSALVAGMGSTLDGVIGGGGARYLFEELERGVLATMPAIELLELHVALMTAYAEGRRDEALDLYERSLPLLLMQAPYRMRLTKFVLKHRGIIATDRVREALPAIDSVSKKLILEMVDSLNLQSEQAVA